MRQARLLRHQKHRNPISKYAIPTCAATQLPWDSLYSTTCNSSFFRLHVLSNKHKKKACAFAHDLGKRERAVRFGLTIDQLWFSNVTDTILTGVCVNSTRHCATVWKWPYETRHTGTTQGACCQIWRAAENKQVQNNGEKILKMFIERHYNNFSIYKTIQSGEGSDCVILGYDAVYFGRRLPECQRNLCHHFQGRSGSRQSKHYRSTYCLNSSSGTRQNVKIM